MAHVGQKLAFGAGGGFGCDASRGFSRIEASVADGHGRLCDETVENDLIVGPKVEGLATVERQYGEELVLEENRHRKKTVQLMVSPPIKADKARIGKDVWHVR